MVFSKNMIWEYHGISIFYGCILKMVFYDMGISWDFLFQSFFNHFLWDIS